jgi:hypothetical protein
MNMRKYLLWTSVILLLVCPVVGYSQTKGLASTRKAAAVKKKPAALSQPQQEGVRRDVSGSPCL